MVFTFPNVVCALKGTQIIGNKKGKLKSNSPEGPSKVTNKKGCKGTQKGIDVTEMGTERRKQKERQKGT